VVEGERFTAPHPGHGQQADHGADRRDTMGRVQRAGRLEQGSDLGIGVDVGDRASWLARE
jgi:hypothetical protein